MSRHSDKTICDFCEKPDGPFIVASGGGYHICRKCTGLAAGMFGMRVDLGDHAPLTRKQSAIYDYVDSYARVNGYSPSYEEIAERFSYNSLATVHEHLHNLKRKGWVSIGFNQARAITCLVRREKAA